MMDTTFTIFDTETTGFDPNEGDKIIEIAAMKFKNGELLEEQHFEALVNPEREIPFESIQVHGITNDKVVDKPTIASVLPEFMDFVGDSVLVAHNAEFDIAFLEHDLFMTNPFAVTPTTVCTKKLSRKLFPNEKFHNLDTITYRFGLEAPKEGRHRALTDVIMLGRVFRKLLDAGNVGSLDELLSLAQER